MNISSLLVSLPIVLALLSTTIFAQKRRPPAGGRVAVVVDERLAALRESPALTGVLVQRVARGRMVAIRGERRTREGITFARVNLTSRTSGWIQRDALVTPNQRGDDERLLRLILASKDFDRIARARIFLDAFPKSSLRPAVLLIFGDAVELAAARLSRDALRRLKLDERNSHGPPEVSYFLNYAGLDRYNRQGIKFGFDAETKRFHYDGAAWKELLRRYPRSAEAAQARLRL